MSSVSSSLLVDSSPNRSAPLVKLLSLSFPATFRVIRDGVSLMPIRIVFLSAAKDRQQILLSGVNTETTVPLTRSHKLTSPVGEDNTDETGFDYYSEMKPARC